MRPNLFRTGSFNCTDLLPTYKAAYTGLLLHDLYGHADARNLFRTGNVTCPKSY